MPKQDTPPDYLATAKANLIAPFNATPQQYEMRIAGALAQATIALAEQQARTADALETANLIAMQRLWLAEGTGPSDSVDAHIRARLGLA